MASYVISDIHGDARRFHAMLEKIGFCREDTLYIIGDVLDRGPDGISLLRQIMGSPNMHMILGNHEYMCLRCHAEDTTEIDRLRWNKNGNAPTLQGLAKLNREEFLEVMTYLKSLPTCLEVTVEGSRFYLVHGFPGECAHDREWNRPAMDTANPVPGCRLIIGHTPVLSLGWPPEERKAYAQALARRGEHLKILHTPGFTDIDCGCGHSYPGIALACLRLEDMREFYV